MRPPWSVPTTNVISADNYCFCFIIFSLIRLHFIYSLEHSASFAVWFSNLFCYLYEKVNCKCIVLLHTTKYQIKNVLNRDMGKYFHMVLDYSVVKCQNILQLFTVNSTTQSLFNYSLSLLPHSHFVPVEWALYYTVNVQVFTVTSITPLLCSI